MFHAFFLNEKSLRGRIDQCGGDIRRVCAKHGLEYELFVTRSIADLQAKTEQCRAREEAVYYAVGGDGTFQALVNAVDLRHTTLQYLPYGSGNNAYRTFYNQPFDLERDILSADTFKADLGQANGEYFVTMLGLALDAKIGANLEKFRWLPLCGKAKYYVSIFYTLLFCAKPVIVRMTVDGAAAVQASSFISITNGPTTGGQTPVSPHSTAFDGKLNALVADALTLPQAVNLFAKINTGGHLKDPRVVQYLFEELIFESNKPLLYEIDGEIRHAERIEIKVCKDAVTLKGKC
jgi:diacylglycerol kinase (ATP)